MIHVPSNTERGVRNVLIVDDDPADAFLIRQALLQSHKNLEIHHVSDGQEALQFLLKQGPYESSPTPHVVTLDLNMPRMNGHETLRRLRSDARLRHLPVIILSTSDSADDIAQAYDGQATCYVRKADELDSLVAHLRCLANFWFEVVLFAER